MPMTAQNGAHGCDCGKVKVTLLNKRNAAEALTAPLNGTPMQSEVSASDTVTVDGNRSFYKRSVGESLPRCGQ